tara:strand:- start:1497 stop:3425 length:1929 start_codon:yes stop_codon:yes gene_type:complete
VINRVNKNILVFLLSILFLNINAQNKVKGVSISEDTLPPHPSAMLDIRSINKGVSFPTMSLEQRDSLEIKANQKGLTIPDGLLVYVNKIENIQPGQNEDKLRGFWFWDNKSTPNWQQIKPKKQVYPKGSIIMYNGDLSGFNPDGLGTGDYEGWALCNGFHGTPDLSGMFVKGVEFSSKELGNNGGENKIILNERNLPNHTHQVDTIKLSEIEVGDHKHEIDEDGGHQHPYLVRDRRKETDYLNYFKGRAKKYNKKDELQSKLFTKPTSIVKLKEKNTSNIKSGSQKLNLSGNIEESGKSDPLSNVPSYYALAYIMHTENQDVPGIYEVPDFTALQYNENNDTSNGENGMPLLGNREGVIITDKSNEFPHPSAILDIYSTNKGVLFPSMTSLQQNSISPETNGLIVYVKEETGRKGFWFWSSVQSKWLQLSTSLPGSKELSLPNGSIIMYVNDSIENRFDASGKGIKGTETEGWAICNGFNGSPKMDKVFFMGYDYIEDSGNKMLQRGGAYECKITEQHMPSHSHKISNIKVDASHTHTLSLEHVQPHVVESSKRYVGRNDSLLPFKRARIKDNGKGDFSTVTTSPASAKLEIKEVDIESVKVSGIPVDLLNKTGEGVPFSNEPRFYKVLFIIKNPLNESYGQ